MENITPLNKSKDQFCHIISKIRSESSVGIDAQLTHAIIIEYLQRLESRLNDIEKKISKPNLERLNG
ncbi:MAG: hypothetical protein AB7S78_08040 [Candidatus Omnitrophota bacterium]